ncbi:MAG: bifunctional nuclease family protein [Actinobacteria bacterium]|nr:bifunctional nuclease family protein [Actinomycetota bacterium]
MELVGVRVEVPANTPVVILREQTGTQRLLPIVIGTPEASSIHAALEGIESPRPLTHDLLVQILEQLSTTLERIVVTEVREHIFFAELHLVTSGRELVVSCRPSDAIAIAVRTGSPIFATEGLLLQAGQHPVEIAEEHDEEAIIDEFRDFLDDLDPDDFKGE